MNRRVTECSRLKEISRGYFVQRQITQDHSFFHGFWRSPRRQNPPPLGNSIQSPTTCTITKYFLIFRHIYPVLQFLTVTSCPGSWCQLNEPCSILFALSLHAFEHLLVKSLTASSSPVWTVPDLTVIPYRRGAPVIIVLICLTLSSYICLALGSPELDTDSQYGLTNTERRGRVTSFDNHPNAAQDFRSPPSPLQTTMDH